VVPIFIECVDHPHTAVVGAFEKAIETRVVMFGVERPSPFAVLIVLTFDNQTVNQMFGNEIILKNTLSFVSHHFTECTDFTISKSDVQTICT
jgi:hypothetical protein